VVKCGVTLVQVCDTATAVNVLRINAVCLCVCQGWEYSAAMFIALNTVALLFISCAYWRMHRAVRSSGLSLRSTQDRHDQALAQRFCIIVATDCLCWIPVIGVKLAALAGTYAC